MPICLTFDRLEGEVDECAVLVVVCVRRPWRASGDPCIPDDRAAVLALAARFTVS